MSFRLMLRLLAAMLLILVGYALIGYRATRVELEHLMHDRLLSVAQLVTGATHYGMLSNQKQEVGRVIEKLASGPHVTSIRVFNKRGEVSFSNDPSELGHTVPMAADACAACHNQSRPLASVPPEHREREYRDDEHGHSLGLITAIPNEAACSEAECHSHLPSQHVLGVLDVRMSAAPLDVALAQMRQHVLLATLLSLLVLGSVTGLFVLRIVQRPMRQLHLGTQRVALGDLQTRIEIDSQDEFGSLARSFNKMTAELLSARTEHERWSRKLERKVVDKTDELGRMQRMVVHMEKMASLGKLSATVAHELNNPLSGMLTYAKLIRRKLELVELPEDFKEEMHRYLRVIQKESERCGGIVRNMLAFARTSEFHAAPANVNEIIDRSLMLVHHHIEMAGVQLETEACRVDPGLVCDAAQLEQALVALLVNAIEAMHGMEQGVLGVRVRAAPNGLNLEISDTGAGISERDIPHVFEPFYTTKEQGDGVGLGLSVVYGIVQRHGGRIDLSSEVGRGTTFQVWLPRKPVRAERATPEAATAAARRS
jgi:two-component system NtrC family sensor kinase